MQNYATVPLFQLSKTYPRQQERRRPPQVHRCNPSLLCQTFLFFAFSSTQCRDLFCPWKAFLLPDDGQAKHPKLLNGQMKNNNQVQSILIQYFFRRQAVIRIRIVSMLYQFLLTFKPLVLGAVQSSQCTVDISKLPSVWGRFFIVIYFWHTSLVSLFLLNVISLRYKILFFLLFMFFCKSYYASARVYSSFCPQVLMSFPVSTSFQKFFAFKYHLPAFCLTRRFG